MSEALNKLLTVMTRLRDPKTGCPWDLEQNFKTIAPYTIEEAYEVVEAIEHNDPEALKDELGDLLFQIVFHAQMGREAGLFDFDAIAEGAANKMIERHPHVFGDATAKTAQDVLVNWESGKAAKRAAQAKTDKRKASVLDGVTTALPAPTHALKLQQRAARVGFEWRDVRGIIAKLHEELGELEVEIERNDRDAMEDECGDLFFVLVNLARYLDIDPETALRRTNRKFERRFRGVEERLAAEGKTPSDVSCDEMEAHWVAIKRAEKAPSK